MTPPKRVLLVDGHEIVRHGIRALLEKQGKYSACGEAGNGQEAIVASRLLDPDLVVIDPDLPDLRGIEAVRKISLASPRARILVFAFDAGADEMRRLFASGAHGCVLKRDPSESLLRALEVIAEGGFFVPDAALSKRSPAALPALIPSPFAVLTKREIEMAALLARGRSNKEAASDMGISVKTAETHRARIMRKLHLRCFAELVHLAVQTGLVQLDLSARGKGF
jgi:DNA-binding NarL/FixJ family response regulator